MNAILGDSPVMSQKSHVLVKKAAGQIYQRLAVCVTILGRLCLEQLKNEALVCDFLVI